MEDGRLQLSSAQYVVFNTCGAKEQLLTTVAAAGTPVTDEQRWAREHLIVHVPVSQEGRSIGNFVLFHDGEVVTANREAPRLFADMVGLLMARVEVERHNNELLLEKETLLRELQHRIKNMLNTMSSLLTLQAGAIREPAALDAVNDIRGRFAGMEVLYDQLYRTNGQGSVPLAPYLTTLVRRVVDMFPNAAGVELSLRVDEFFMNAKRLSSLGLIVNELVTNAMKYAFVDRHTGARLTVRCTRESGTITLTLADNGVGMPVATREALRSLAFGANVELGSFGITIVQALVQQLDGTVTYAHDHGTVVTVAIPE